MSAVCTQQHTKVQLTLHYGPGSVFIKHYRLATKERANLDFF